MKACYGYLLLVLALPALANTVEYDIDPTHSFVQFRTKHLGYSWLYARFDKVSGSFVYDSENPAHNSIQVMVDVTSVDSNHDLRDEHLRSEKYLQADQHPDAKFVSTAYQGDGNAGQLSGVLTLHGVSRPVVIPVRKVGEGADPWGGYRVGFEGSYTLDARQFGYQYKLGEQSYIVELQIGIEGIRKADAAPLKH